MDFLVMETHPLFPPYPVNTRDKEGDVGLKSLGISMPGGGDALVSIQ